MRRYRVAAEESRARDWLYDRSRLYAALVDAKIAFRNRGPSPGPPRGIGRVPLWSYSRFIVPLQILLRPSPLEYRRFHKQYEALAGDLEGQGVLVRLLPAAEVHAHAVLPTSTAQNGADDYDLLIQVGSSAGEIVGTARLVEFVQRRLRRPKGEGIAPRRANVYLTDGERHDFLLDADV